jgi:hypothetical protein
MTKEEVKTKEPESSKRFQSSDQTFDKQDMVELIDKNSPGVALNFRALREALGESPFVLTKVNVNDLKFEAGSESLVNPDMAIPEKGAIVVNSEGMVIDGRHRSLKAKKEGQQTIDAYIPIDSPLLKSSKRFQPVTPEQDAAYLQAVKAGDSETARKISDAVALKAGALNDAEYLYHGGSGIKKSFEAGASRSGMGNAYLTNNKNAAWKYAIGGGIDNDKSLPQYRREQLKQMPSRNPQVQRLFILGDAMDFSEFKYKPTAEKLFDIFGEDVMEKKLKQYSSKARQALEDGDDLESVLSNALDEGGWVQEDTDATRNVPELQVLQGMGLLDGYLKHYGKNVVSYSDAEAGGKTYVVFDTNQIKSAEPIVYDDAGNVIPLSQRFNLQSPDIRFQPDPTSPNILNGSDGSRIIKSNSGKYRVYLATGALAGVKDSLESAQKLVQSKSK